jgi:hypothetical protein
MDRRDRTPSRHPGTPQGPCSGALERRHPPPRRRVLTLFAAAAGWVGSAVDVHAADACRAASPATPLTVVELYTSEGCSSCPPADRWLSGLVGRTDVLALAFHVDYWDRLGWPDRFADAAKTERQHRLQRAAGAPYVYTPQVVINGRDERRWATARLVPPAAVPIAVALVRDGRRVTATIAAAGSAPVAGYWAVLEDGHESRVKAGENRGETLRHDHVVTLYRPVSAWTPGAASQRFELELPTASAAPRRVAFVVTDAQGLAPRQAAVLGC